MLSCNDDDTNDLDSEMALEQAQNASEDREIPIAELEANIEIPGAIKKTGAAPAPTGTLDFQITTEDQEGFLGSGFDITFSSANVIAGAYIQLLDVNGNKVDGYFDIPASKFDLNGRRRSGPLKNSSLGRIKEEGDLLIDVNFEEAIKPGRFCYEICIYDDQNNISRIEQICVEIEAWGGNASIVGEWIFDRREPDNESAIPPVYCDNGDTLTNVPNEIILQDIEIFVLNADGSYYEEYTYEDQDLDYDQSKATCTAVYEDAELERERYNGFWAFNETDKTLTVIDFEFVDLLNPDQGELFEDGDIYLEGVLVEVINNELVITDPDGNEKEIYKRK